MAVKGCVALAETSMVVSGKGGVGKSSLCAGVAAGLCRRGKRVLLAEADMGFRSLDILLDMEGSTVYDLEDVTEGRCPPSSAILVHRPTGIRLLPAAADPSYLPREAALRALARQAGEVFEFIFFDCGAGYSPLTAILARICGMALVVTTPDEAAVRAAGRVSGFLAGEGLTCQRLAINMIPRALAPSPAIRDLDDVIDLTGVRLIGALPKEDFPPLPPRRGGALARQEMDNIAGRLLGEEPELLYQS